LGISALSIWGGNQQWCDDLKRRVRKVAGFDIPVALASDAVLEALKLHGIKKKIAVMEPYYPSIEPRMRGVLGPHGYDIVRFNHMRGKSPAYIQLVLVRLEPNSCPLAMGSLPFFGMSSAPFWASTSSTRWKSNPSVASQPVAGKFKTAALIRPLGTCFGCRVIVSLETRL